MGTDFSIAIVSTSKEIADAQAKKAIDCIASYEQRFSRFIPASELSTLNQKKHLHVSEYFMRVIERAYALFVKTNGVFNPLVQIERFGYDKSFDELGGQKVEESNEPYDIDFTSTYIDQETNHITLQEGQKIDFGGILKGYLADLICRSIQQSSSIHGVIVNIGGDIHTEGTSTEGKHFVFEIYNPISQKDAISIALHNQSLATSGTYKRVWETTGGKRNHILNASGTDNPDSTIISASVIAGDGSVAEAYAKVFLSVGEEEAQKILKGEKLSYILIKADGEVIKHI